MKTRVLTLTTITLLTLPAIAQERGQKRDQPERKKGDLENIEKRIKSAVERGDISKEEAKAKFTEVKKMMEKKRQHQDEAMERSQKMRRELELKHRETANHKRNEQADHQKRREHEEHARHEQQERRKHEDRDHEERSHHEHNHSERQLDEAREHAERQRERHHHARFDAIEKSLHQAVEAGLISGLEAQKTMAKLHLAAIKHQQKKERR